MSVTKLYFRNAQSLANALESLNFTLNVSQKVDYTIQFQKFWHFEMSAIWLNFRNASIVCYFLKRLYSTVQKCFDRMLIWLIKFQKFGNFEMFVIRLKFGDTQSLSYDLKRLYFTVVKCILKSWFDHQISEILTFWNVCYMTHFLAEMVFNRLLAWKDSLYFAVLKCLHNNWFYRSNFRNFDISKCLLYGSRFEMLNRLIRIPGTLIFHGIKCLQENWFGHSEMSAQLSKCSIAC